MKLILKYCRGEFEGCNITVPFEYSSVKSAKEDLNSEWRRWYKEQSLWNIHGAKMPLANHSKKVWDKWNNSRPQTPNTTLKLGTIQDLLASNFTFLRNNGDKYLPTIEYDAPVILTLDDWFEVYKE